MTRRVDLNDTVLYTEDSLAGMEDGEHLVHDNGSGLRLYIKVQSGRVVEYRGEENGEQLTVEHLTIRPTENGIEAPERPQQCYVCYCSTGGSDGGCQCYKVPCETTTV